MFNLLLYYFKEELMDMLHLKFIEINRNENYLLKPKYIVFLKLFYIQLDHKIKKLLVFYFLKMIFEKKIKANLILQLKNLLKKLKSMIIKKNLMKTLHKK